MRGLPVLILISFLLLLPSAAFSDPAKKNTLVFAALPMETPEIVQRETRPLLNYLEQRLGLKITVVYPVNHQELQDKFRDNSVDLAFLGPLPYITLKNAKSETEPLVIFLENDGKASYTCALMTPLDGVINPEDLIGMPLALTDPLSTCGYFITEYVLNTLGLSLEQTGYSYLGRHDLVALSVARGEFAGGGVKTSIGRRYLHLGLQILAESEPVPGRPLIANGATISAELMTELRSVLTENSDELARDPLIKQSQWGPLLQYGAIKASDRDFDPLRRMLGKREIPQQ